MALDGSRVALQIRDGVGMRIILVDLRHGRVIGELRLTAAGPAP